MYAICSDITFGFYEQKLDETLQEHLLQVKAANAYVRMSFDKMVLNLRVLIHHGIGSFKGSNKSINLTQVFLSIFIEGGKLNDFIIEALTMHGSVPLISLSKLILFFVSY